MAPIIDCSFILLYDLFIEFMLVIFTRKPLLENILIKIYYLI